MPSYDSHLLQAKKNLLFISKLNSINNFWDWKVTCTFYTALHLVNAHLANKANLHYRSHSETDLAINPFGHHSFKFSEENYLSYKKLQNYSRRARYLCHEENTGEEDKTYETYEIHLAKCIRHLDKLLAFFSDNYGATFDITNITCVDLNKNEKLKYFSPQSR